MTSFRCSSNAPPSGPSPATLDGSPPLRGRERTNFVRVRRITHRRKNSKAIRLRSPVPRSVAEVPSPPAAGRSSHTCSDGFGVGLFVVEIFAVAEDQIAVVEGDRPPPGEGPIASVRLRAEAARVGEVSMITPDARGHWSAGSSASREWGVLTRVPTENRRRRPLLGSGFIDMRLPVPLGDVAGCHHIPQLSRPSPQPHDEAEHTGRFVVTRE